MLRFQEKQLWRAVMSSKVTIVALFVLVFFAARGVWGVYRKAKESSASLAIAEKAYAELDNRQAVLVAQIAALKTSRGIEEEIRSRYEVAKPGEEVALIVDDATATPAATSSEPSWWDELVSWIRQQ